MTLSSPPFWSFKATRILLSVMRHVFEGQQHFSKMEKGENYISDKTCGTGGGKDDERETPCWNSYYHPSPPPPIYQKRSLAHLTPSHQTKSNPRIAKTESTSGSRYWIPEGVRCPDDGSAIPSCEFSSCFTSSVKPWGAVQCPLYLTKKWWPAWNSHSISA